VTAVEPDPGMAEILRRNTSELDVEVRVGSFEEFRPAVRAGLLYCGQAWHWIDPAVRWELAAQALKPAGTIALFWNRDRPADPAVTQVLRTAHEAYAPEIWRITEAAGDDEKDWPELSEHPLYTDYQAEIYRWTRTVATADYTAYMATQSSYIRLPAATREALLSEIVGRLGDTIEVAMDTILYMARTR
jgi:hypothetical protein